MNRCVFIIPYFGKFPNYFDLFLKSCGKNSKFDFLIITDNYGFAHPGNVIVKNSTFQDIRQRIQSHFDFEICLPKPYKICDYKPAYGYIFQDLIRNYEFWGHCDTDLIFGDLSNYFTNEVLNSYDRFLNRGHLILYRNSSLTNNMFMSNSKELFIDYKYAYSTKYTCHFDELKEWIPTCKTLGIRQWMKTIYADIDCNSFRFIQAQNEISKYDKYDLDQIYRYSNGKVTRYYIDDNYIKSDEWAYIHLQKRKMKYEVNLDKDSFFIVPNAFISGVNCDEEFIRKYSEDNFYLDRKLGRIKEIVTNLRNGALDYRYRKFKGRH